MPEDPVKLAKVMRLEQIDRSAEAAKASHIAVKRAELVRDQWVLTALEAGNTLRGLGDYLGVTKDTIARWARKARQRGAETIAAARKPT